MREFNYAITDSYEKVELVEKIGIVGNCEAAVDVYVWEEVLKLKRASRCEGKQVW